MLVDDVQIRPASAADISGIVDVLFEAFSVFHEHYTPGAFAAVTPQRDELLGRLAEGPIWVAERSGQVIGTVSVVAEPEWLYIRSMAVSPSAQGLGVGGKLIDAVESYAVESGFNTLYLYTTSFLAGAIRLYERNGFVIDRLTPAEEWFGVPGQGMKKEIGAGVRIREVKIEDAELLSAVATKAYLDHFTHLWDDEGRGYADRSFNLKALQGQINDKENRYYLAFLGMEPVGFLKLRPNNVFPGLETRNAFEIERIYLTKEAQGKGIGKAMMQLSLGLARDMGKDIVWLKAMDSNSDVIGFYEGFGFKTFATDILDLPSLKPELSGMFVLKSNIKELAKNVTGS